MAFANCSAQAGRISGSLRAWLRVGPFFLAVVAAALPPMLFAQFQVPTDDELKMTADPKAPGAAAVYLYREETTDDERHVYSMYERVKVLTEKGKELATVKVPYVLGVDKVAGIQGRTIHADGTIVSLTATPADLMDYKVKDFQVNKVVFTLPAVEVGSILEYRLNIRLPDFRASQPTWEIQQPYFVHRAHYSFHPYVTGTMYGIGGSLDRMMYSERPIDKVQVAQDKHKNIYTLDVTDVPPLPDEDWMPPLNTIRWNVDFYYTNAKTGPGFWTEAGKAWAQYVEDFVKPTGGMKKAVEQIVAPDDSEVQKARKIYTAVMKLDNTDFSRRKTQAERKKEKLKDIHKAEDVWKQQSGTADEIALLYSALARTAGLKVWPVQVVNRDKAFFDDQYLALGQLDDYLALININGKDVYLDPGQKMCPFGCIHWKHALASGLKLTDSGAAPVTTSPIDFRTAVVDRIADLTIDAQGSVTGTLRFVMHGPDALHWRQITIENDEDEVKKQFNDSIKDDVPEGVEADFDHFLALDDYSSNLIGVVKVSGNIGAATGKRFLLPGQFFEARGKHPFVAQDKRITPIDVRYPKAEEDEVTYHLPAGYTVESTPQPVNNTWPDHAMIAIKSTMNGDTVVVHRTLLYNFTLLDSKTYPQLHDFYQKVATADQQQLVLARAPAAKGN